ncbi:MAG: hypothetical protein RQ741_00930, partial [Wenzhouxiangellaceae bacterium]|nr:hypothetical protein [Wenzhouxiangellaceae bacterium]
ATVNCDAQGFSNGISVSDSHTVDLFTADASVSKTGPEQAKAGDAIIYTIEVTDLSSDNAPPLVCTVTDPLLGLTDVPISVGTNSFDFTIPGDASGSIVNTATVNCDAQGFSNGISVSDSHTIELITPAVSMTKSCQPDPVLVGGTIEWSITVTNDGNAALDCLVNDPTADLVDEAVVLQAGQSETLTASRIVESGDVPLILNTADATCDVTGFPNQVSADASTTCEVQPVGEEVCRTPGFWGTHAGDDKRRSTDLTQLVIDAGGGSLPICGGIIDNTDVGNPNSAIEAMCVRIEGELQRQLARQLTAMSLNCIVSGGGADCSGISVEDLFAEANAACAANDVQLGYFIDRVDCFNNGGQFDESTEQCVIDEFNNCHNRELDESTDIFDGVSPLPGPAGSARACSAANGNGIKVVPAF